MHDFISIWDMKMLPYQFDPRIAKNVYNHVCFSVFLFFKADLGKLYKLTYM